YRISQQVSRNLISFQWPQCSVHSLEKIQLLSPHMLSDNLESIYGASTQSCVRVNQDPGAVQYIPVWEHLHGLAHYKVRNSEKDDHAFAQLTVSASERAVMTSTFRCQLYEGGTCHSKLWLYSHIRPVQPIRLHPLDRLQTFFGSLTVRQSRNTERPFDLHGFDWTVRVRSRTPMRPDLGMTIDRTDSDHSFKPTVIFIPPTSLKQLHRVHSQGISSIPNISSPDPTSENSTSVRQSKEVLQKLAVVSLQKSQPPENKQMEAEYDEGNAKPDGVVIHRRRKKKRCKHTLTVPDYLRREVVRMMMMKRRYNDRKQKSKNGS
ncbi:hypothetical protein AHF37_01157, partial [Paragonimus kellicotti]